MKKLKKTKKMRGGLLGPESSKQLAEATDSYGQWWDKTKAGTRRAELETNIAIGDFKHHHGQTRQSFAGSPPTVTPTTSLPPLPPIHNPRRPVIYSPTQDPLPSVQKYNKPTETIIGGKRKTKKRRRKRKKKKTKRKKRRRKRKTKKKRRKKYN